MTIDISAEYERLYKIFRNGKCGGLREQVGGLYLHDATKERMSVEQMRGLRSAIIQLIEEGGLKNHDKLWGGIALYETFGGEQAGQDLLSELVHKTLKRDEPKFASSIIRKSTLPRSSNAFREQLTAEIRDRFPNAVYADRPARHGQSPQPYGRENPRIAAVVSHMKQGRIDDAMGVLDSIEMLSTADIPALVQLGRDCLKENPNISSYICRRIAEDIRGGIQDKSFQELEKSVTGELDDQGGYVSRENKRDAELRRTFPHLPR